jgi:ABC-type transport system substrate-binding protein
MGDASTVAATREVRCDDGGVVARRPRQREAVSSGFLRANPANQNGSAFCDPRVEARVDDALAAQRTQADAIWQDVYRRIDAEAPYVALVNRRALTLVSKRVGNFQHHPLWGPLYEQMWVR